METKDIEKVEENNLQQHEMEAVTEENVDKTEELSETEETIDQQSLEEKRKTKQSSLFTKILLLIYLGYSIRQSFQNLLPGENVPLAVIICIVFLLIFVGLAVKDILDLRKMKRLP